MLEADLATKIAVGAAATWRLTALLVDEDGPFDVFRRLRTWAGMNSKLLGGLLDCFWCTSVWIAFGVTPVALSRAWPVLLPFALSAAAIVGNELLFVLTATGDPLPLSVALTNNGGHDARDYYTWAAFGEAMVVQTAPSGCTPIGNPPAPPVWKIPADIPDTASVYVCDRGVISPGETELTITVQIAYDIVE